MALDFNQRSFTKTVDQVAIDEGLRAYMLKVYNYMTIGLLLTGLIADALGLLWAVGSIAILTIISAAIIQIRMKTAK